MFNPLRIPFILATAVMVVALPHTVLAVDGQVTITQAKAMNGNVTPGDAPGFPVTISVPGSYVVSSMLFVPNATTHGIVIDSDHVTIDLNGFAILGPVDCSGGLFPCAGAPLDGKGAGSGIVTNVRSYEHHDPKGNGPGDGWPRHLAAW